MTIRSRMSLILGLIGPQPLELFALEFALELKKLLYFTLFTLASTNINQSAPNLVKIYTTLRPQMSSILDLIRPEQPELFALELKNNLLYLTLFTL